MNQWNKSLLTNKYVQFNKLKDLFDIDNNGIDKKIKNDETKVKILNYLDVYHNNYINSNIPSMLVSASKKELIKCNILKDDIFITPTSETIEDLGHAAVALEDIEDCCYSYHIMRLRPKPNNRLLSAFVMYFFNSSWMNNWLMKNAHGETRFGLLMAQWENIEIPIPSLEIQQKIVKILDSFTELTTELTKRKEQINYFINRYVQIDSNKAKVKLINQFEFIRGLTYDKNSLFKHKNNDSIPLLRSNNVDLNLIDITDLKNVKYLSLSSVPKSKYLLKNDILMCIANGSEEQIGKVALINESNKFTFGSFMGIFRQKRNSELNSEYLFFLLKTKYFKNFLKDQMNVSTIHNINNKIIENFLINFPSKKIQNKISNFLLKISNYSLNSCQGLIKEIALRKKQYEYYRDQLLSFTKEEIE